MLLSSPETLQHIATLLRRYHRLPFVPVGTIPGIVVENILAQARGMRRLGKYDFVDVVSDAERFGLQVKSSKAGSPLTWQRAKVPNSGKLREASKEFPEAAQALGKMILTYINDHMARDLDKHNIDEIGYARVVANRDSAFYFERPLIDRSNTILFDPALFTWSWAEDRKGSKEQRGSLGGYDAEGVRWFSWHSQDQLHFINERIWWPPEGDPHRVDFSLSESKIGLDDLTALLDSSEAAHEFSDTSN